MNDRRILLSQDVNSALDFPSSNYTDIKVKTLYFPISTVFYSSTSLQFTVQVYDENNTLIQSRGCGKINHTISSSGVVQESYIASGSGDFVGPNIGITYSTAGYSTTSGTYAFHHIYMRPTNSDGITYAAFNCIGNTLQGTGYTPIIPIYTDKIYTAVRASDVIYWDGSNYVPAAYFKVTAIPKYGYPQCLFGGEFDYFSFKYEPYE